MNLLSTLANITLANLALVNLALVKLALFGRNHPRECRDLPRLRHVPAPPPSDSPPKTRNLTLSTTLDREKAILVLFSELMKKKSVIAKPPACETTLTHVTRADIVMIARGFATLVMSTPSEEEAVTVCITKYPCIRQLCEAHTEFEELLVLAGVRILKDSTRYAKIRLLFGAGLSMFDTATGERVLPRLRSSGASAADTISSQIFIWRTSSSA